jgi:ribonuclease III
MLDLKVEHQQALNDLQGSLGYTFTNLERLETALRHRSYVHQRRDSEAGAPHKPDNQRYEFLGDAVLGLCVSTLLYRTFPELNEGDLSRMRAGLVNEMQLARLAREIGVPAALLLGRGEETTRGRDKNSILADALEAIVAAVYLDGGFPAAMNLVEGLLGTLIARASRDDLLKDFKTRLQEETQQLTGKIPEYRMAGSEGPDHARVFSVNLILDGQTLSTGQGRSKKEAEQSAAHAALEVLKQGALTPTAREPRPVRNHET